MAETKVSPYKRLKTANKSWVGYISLSKLEQHKAHKVLGMVQTNHPQFGPGQQVTVELGDGRKYRVQLPGKYLAQLSSDDILALKQDMTSNSNPYLVFREKMLDNSFRMDIIEKNPVNDAHFVTWSDVPELEDIPSDDENEDVATKAVEKASDISEQPSDTSDVQKPCETVE